jgi:hypothetical protein
MQKNYRPFYDIAFDFKSSLSVNDAVLAMLGWTHSPYREVTQREQDFNHRVYCGVSEFGDETYYDEPSLFEVLKEVKNKIDRSTRESLNARK